MKSVFSNFSEVPSIQGQVRLITTDSVTHEVLRETVWYGNLVMLGTDTGKELILDRLNAINTYSLNITHAELGSGTTPPTNGDVALQTPLARSPKVTGVVNVNILTLQFFFADVDLPNGTYNEFGAFIDGSGTIGSGRIFDRSIFGVPYVKSSSEDTTVQLDITIT